MSLNQHPGGDSKETGKLGNDQHQASAVGGVEVWLQLMVSGLQQQRCSCWRRYFGEQIWEMKRNKEKLADLWRRSCFVLFLVHGELVQSMEAQGKGTERGKGK